MQTREPEGEARHLRRVEQRIRPVRGLILTRNSEGAPYVLADLKRWLRLNADVFKTKKVDVFLTPSRASVWPALSELAARCDLRLSLRTDCLAPPGDCGALDKMDLLDVFLAPPTLEAEYLDAWLGACEGAGLPVRLQLHAPFGEDFDAVGVTDRVLGASVASVNITLTDPFVERPPCKDAAHAHTTIDRMNALVSEIADRGIEANLLYLPLCLATPGNLPRALNSQQFFLDHQQYHHMSYEFALGVFACSPNSAGKAISIKLGAGTSIMDALDKRLLPWILYKTSLHLRLYAWRKLTRALRVLRGKPKPLEESADAYERELDRMRNKADKELGPVCARCSLRRICDHASPALKRSLPGVDLVPRDGDAVMSPMHFAAGEPKHYDDIDAARAGLAEDYLALAKKANALVTDCPPTREVEPADYCIEGQYTHHMPGGNRWYSFTSTEKLSTPVTRTQPPLTISVTFGGGIADFIGFSFGRHCKFLVPMEAFSHVLVLHVDAEGRYAMLRDGVPVRPTEFEGVQYVPERLAGVLEPRIAIWNIDGAIVTQTVLLWEDAGAFAIAASEVKYSVLIACTRYSRRLQAVLLSLAHQQGIGLEKLEAIVGYVPGVDATDDIIDSMALAHPKLRIVRSPFPEQYAKSKGFLINESANKASGEWIVLLDADTLPAPDMFAKFDAMLDSCEADACHFVAADGRTMLTPETTARILLGEIEPWRDWDALLRGGGEFRLREADGVPIGFCQCFRKSCMEKVKYPELDHFEGSDWFFGYGMRTEFGMEKRLSGVPVVHLDHGGSQWYGTRKQR